MNPLTLETVSKFDTLPEQHAALTEHFRSLSPIADKYVSCELSRFGYRETQTLRIHVHYGDGFSFSGDTVEQVVDKIKACSPEKQRLERITNLKAELAKLEGAGE